MEPLPLYRAVAPAAFVAALGAVCAARDEPRLRAILLGVGFAVGYAVLQDQVSARLCPEYFTVFHNPIPGLTDPTLLGLAWGFLGGWWGGAVLGLSAGLTATAGRRPPLPVRALVRPMAVLFVAVAAVTAATGLGVAFAADRLGVELGPAAAAAVPADRRQKLLVVASYHFASHLSAAVGAVGLCGWAAVERKRRAGRP